MTGRENEVRRRLRERHAGIEPDASFAARVIANLPRNEAWAFDWAVRRVLPMSLALALVLMIAVAITGRSATPTTVSASVSSTSQGTNDPLDWLLEGRGDRR